MLAWSVRILLLRVLPAVEPSYRVDVLCANSRSPHPVQPLLILFRSSFLGLIHLAGIICRVYYAFHHVQAARCFPPRKPPAEPRPAHREPPPIAVMSEREASDSSLLASLRVPGVDANILVDRIVDWIPTIVSCLEINISPLRVEESQRVACYILIEIHSVFVLAVQARLSHTGRPGDAGTTGQGRWNVGSSHSVVVQRHARPCGAEGQIDTVALLAAIWAAAQTCFIRVGIADELTKTKPGN